MNLFSYPSIAFPNALITSTFLLFFSSLSFLDSLAIGEMNYNQIKKQIIPVKLTRDLSNPIVIIKLDIMKGIAKIENKIDIKLKITKDSLSKIILLLFF